jgi:hypothetical protein
MPSGDDCLLKTYYVPEAGVRSVSVSHQRKQTSKIKENTEEKKKKSRPGGGGTCLGIPALGRQRQQISEFEASLVYRVSSRTARAIQRNPVSGGEKKPKTNKQTKNKTKQKNTEEVSWDRVT